MALYSSPYQTHPPLFNWKELYAFTHTLRSKGSDTWFARIASLRTVTTFSIASAENSAFAPSSAISTVIFGGLSLAARRVCPPAPLYPTLRIGLEAGKADKHSSHERSARRSRPRMPAVRSPSHLPAGSTTKAPTPQRRQADHWITAKVQIVDYASSRTIVVKRSDGSEQSIKQQRWLTALSDRLGGTVPKVANFHAIGL